ncbi:MAG TPA: 2-oxoglutarate dehydrogenase E1 component [Planctomycetaceae bacterium]|jgi:2-oxoglutarate dehydrogenase E1 component|nr:2-oxoglutarate dehydrogenase E1 component [Planctomycetaceae bacterium]
MSDDGNQSSNGSLSAENAAFAERLLSEYLAEPSRVSPSWRRYFSELLDSDGKPEVRKQAAPAAPASLTTPAPTAATTPSSIVQPARPLSDGHATALHLDGARLQDRLRNLMQSFRGRGHLAARLDPLGLSRPEPDDLLPATHGLSESDLDRAVSAESVDGAGARTVRDVVQRLRNTYCSYIGAQFLHIDDAAVRSWLQERMERTENHIRLSRPEQLRILTRLTDAVIFEQFVRKKFVGAKTFSLEGAESLIPLLDLAILKASRSGIVEIVLGMAHRGRLNVLANIIGKRPQEIFWEFDGGQAEVARSSQPDIAGDLTYHLGFSGDWQGEDGRRIHLSLCFNPSHLEFINPVALGRMRAKQDRAGDHERRRGLVLLIHGDAAFAGEGVVQETLNLSQLTGYTTGGALHVIVNNQLGFTTSPEEARSSMYASDVAKMLQSPIFHVNGEHPEAVAQVVDLALDFRSQFQRDVVIDMYSYRRWGHNEADEPSFTQPISYKAIEHKPSVRDCYLEHLLKLDEVTREEADRIASQRYDVLEQAFDEVHRGGFAPSPQTLAGIWEGFRGGNEPPDDEPRTSVPADRLSQSLRRLAQTPTGFHLHRKLKRATEERLAMAEGKQALDWAAAEALALGTLAVEGHPVRLSGQDSQRGTFSQRHAVLHDVVDGKTYMPLAHLADDQARVEVINSPLSEAGVLGFEYGYSLDEPEGLIAWEAQFGDFANAGQVIIDQFLAGGADRWRRLSGLVLLLPHGWEGSGPEHSSARLERFLNLAARDNLQVVAPTTPAQYFHVLRRQVLRRWRKPLVVMTPKSLLRHPRVVSPLSDLAEGSFSRILPDTRSSPEATSRVLLCSGKVYYDLTDFREKNHRDDVAILRFEELYPLAVDLVRKQLEPYADGTPVFWVQEEPRNMGAWPALCLRFDSQLFDRFSLSCVARAESASPATGSHATHKREQQDLVERAFGETQQQKPA